MKRFLATGIAVGVLLVTWPSMFPVPSLALAGASESQAATPSAAPAPKPDELDRLLAPIALHPDALLAQMLVCATKPAKVAALEEWLAANPTLKGSALQEAATKSGFDPSFAAIVIFPDVVKGMASQIDWTTRVGKAFAADRSAVFASIQRLRQKANQAGKLKSSPQQDVETKTTSSGEQVIVIEPSNPQVVYVPQYNPQTVYTSSTVVVQDDDDTAEAVAAGVIGFTAGIALGAAMDNSYYYGPYGWHGGGYMYNDAWDDYEDFREDSREDWQDHREDMLEDAGDRREDIADERGDRAGTAQQQRTERQQTAQQQRTERQASPEAQAQREQRQSQAGATASQARSSGGGSPESRGYSSGDKAERQRSGSGSDAFSGYSSGKSERAASSRGQAAAAARAAGEEGAGDEHSRSNSWPRLRRSRVRGGPRRDAGVPGGVACSGSANLRVAGGCRQGAHPGGQGRKARGTDEAPRPGCAAPG